MRRIFFATAVLLSLLITGMSFSQPNAIEKKPIPIEDVLQHGILGHLGVPLGTVVEVDATIVDGDSLRSKAVAGQYLLRVERVNNTELKKPALKEFGPIVAGLISLPNGHFELYEMLYGEKAKILNSEQIEEMNAKYVGTRKSLVVYESGRFVGRVSNMPKEMPSWADTSFHFKTSLVVLSVK